MLNEQQQSAKKQIKQMEIDDDGHSQNSDDESGKKHNSNTEKGKLTYITSTTFCCFKRLFKDQSEFGKLSPKQKRARISYLWKRVRLVVGHRGLLQRLMFESQQEEIKRFGLDPEIEQRLGED